MELQIHLRQTNRVQTKQTILVAIVDTIVMIATIVISAEIVIATADVTADVIVIVADVNERLFSLKMTFCYLSVAYSTFSIITHSFAPVVTCQGQMMCMYHYSKCAVMDFAKAMSSLAKFANHAKVSAVRSSMRWFVSILSTVWIPNLRAIAWNSPSSCLSIRKSVYALRLNQTSSLLV